VESTPLHGDERGVVTELAFRPGAAIAPHTNSNLAYLLVIEGGGFVQVGDERTRVAAGEAVVWPPDVIHAAWTELTPMRAIVVEFAAAWGDASTETTPAKDEPPASPERGLAAEGSLAPAPAVLPPDRESPEREPW
jgi:quercetin dioxygenase-like cupin family protein